MRKQLQSRYLTLETRKDGTKFTSRALRDAAESLQTISRSYSEKQTQLVDEVCTLRCSMHSQKPGCSGAMQQLHDDLWSARRVHFHAECADRDYLPSRTSTVRKGPAVTP